MDEEDSRLERLLESLDADERRRLLRSLLAGEWLGAPGGGDLADLLEAERWLLDRMSAADTPAKREARGRIWLIFMLMRYGGLRLAEIFALRPEDFRWTEDIVAITGQRARLIPMPSAVMRRMRRIWLGGAWEARGERPLYCDPSQLRRLFNQCAGETSLDAAIFSSRVLRRHRALELERAGVHSGLIAFFLDGARAEPGNFADPQGLLIRLARQGPGKKNRTSARNAFEGRISALRSRGILVEAELETADDLAVRAVITETSRKSLGLAVGRRAVALVKAPWVSVFPAGEVAPAEANCYGGAVESRREDDLAIELLVTLAQGRKMCAIYANGRKPGSGVEPGAAVNVAFDPFSVIISM